MINRAKLKLKDNGGATILMALMLMMVCFVIGGVILGAALTNMRKAKNRQEQLQVYNSVSSAAQLIRDRVDGLHLSGEKSVLIYSCSGASFDPAEYITITPRHTSEYGYVPLYVKEGGADVLTELLTEGAEQVYLGEETYKDNLPLYKPFTSWEKTFIINDNSYPIIVKVTIDKSYRITFTLSPEDAEWANDYNITLLIPTETCEEVISQEYTEQAKEHFYERYDFEAGRIEEGSFWCQSTKTINTKNIVYGTGTIYKGAGGR